MHCQSTVEYEMSAREMLCISPDDTDSKLRKHHEATCNIETTNNHLADAIERHMGDDKKEIIADYIRIDISDGTEEEIRNMLRMNKQVRSGQLADMNVTEMRIDLSSDAKPFTSTLYKVGPKTWELEQTKWTAACSRLY